jgi:hypothetical protein
MPAPPVWAGRPQQQQFAALNAATRESVHVASNLRSNEPRGIEQVDADAVIDVVAANPAKLNSPSTHFLLRLGEEVLGEISQND